MATQLGTDEAGYGPNLGPLTVSATLWKVDDSNVNLYQRLSRSLTCCSGERSNVRMWIADSKSVYGGSKRIGNLELPVLALLKSIHGQTPDNLSGLFKQLGVRVGPGDSAGCPWHTPDELKIPLEASHEAIEAASRSFRDDCQSNGISLKSMVCEVIFPLEFNRGLREYNNKATLLSARTLGLVQDAISADGAVGVIGCDKHGGRSRYADMIRRFMDVDHVQTVVESRSLSEYCLERPEGKLNIRFQARGESFLPTALASMVAKYVRELGMKMWNRYWCDQISGLQPTRGYPQDAKRFLQDIAPRLEPLGIESEAFWRER